MHRVGLGSKVIKEAHWSIYLRELDGSIVHIIIYTQVKHLPKKKKKKKPKVA